MTEDKSKRIGKQLSDSVQWPETTLSGSALPVKPYETIGLGGGHFVVVDSQISKEAEQALVLELTGLVKSYPTKTTPKDDNK